MITVKILKKLLEKVPDDAKLWAYEGEDTGIAIEKDGKEWFITASDKAGEENNTNGFEED